MSIIFFIVGLSVLILIHEVGHFLAAKYFGLLVEEFGFGFPPRLFAKKIGETEYSLNLLPFGGFVKIHGENRDARAEEKAPERSFWFLPVWKRSLVIVSGVVMNFLLGWILAAAIYMIGAPEAVVITAVANNSPAWTAGILVGDTLADFQKSEDFISFVAASKAKEISLRVLRAGETKQFNLTPRANPPAGEGAIGVVFTETGFERLPFFSALKLGLINSFTILWEILKSMANLVIGIFIGAPALEGFVGPVGIFEIANQAAKFGLVYLLNLISLISLNLVILNILPIPALDGGRLFFLLIEKIKGSPVSQTRETLAHTIGFILLLLLMVVITVRDVARLF